ncbi:MAG: hypothetical protein Aurels2KO_01550 [Aureliella sp.]
MANEPNWLSSENVEGIESLLRSRGLLAEGQHVESAGMAGEGNMNVTLRVRVSGGKSLVVKQSRRFVAKYDFIPAPLERAIYEARFYQFARQHDSIASRMPQLIDWVADQYVLILEDLGEASDATTVYQSDPTTRDRILGEILPPLAQWLCSLHSAPKSHSWDASQFSNSKLRRLNHEHIFILPFREQPAIDLDAVTPGLTEVSHSFRTDESLTATIQSLGQRYLADGDPKRGDCLLHGDFYPGSWLKTHSGPMVIDPEFCFAGPAEFDWSVLVAHMRLCGACDAIESVRQLLPPTIQLNWSLVNAFAGVEVLRRLLGVAQLPLVSDLNEKERLIAAAADDVRAFNTSTSETA